MSESLRCPICGIAFPADAPAGLCPKCLVQAGYESRPVSGPAEPGPTKSTPPVSGFVPPSIEELVPLFPQLEFLELLGQGGMGAVYKARQPGLDRLVALKILPPEISHDPAFAERFQREARALARLSHPHIVAVYDFGTTGSGIRKNSEASAEFLRAPLKGLCYIVMEFVDGANLRQTIRTGKLVAAEALAIVPQICEALQFAHDEGIVHRDIKPENILIDKRGRVKIADFGLAKLLGTDASDHSLTATHQVMGTLRYMAPEQMQGSREVDHRADIYSLGVVFYELLTGELPMGKFAPPSKKVQVDVRLDEIVLRALEQEPEQRYQHASEVKTDVDAIVQSGAASRQLPRASPTGTVTLAARWNPRDATGWLIRMVNTLYPPVISYCVWVSGIFLLIYASGVQGQQVLERNPSLLSYILVLLGLLAVLVTIAIYVYKLNRVVRSLTLSAKGVTMQFGSQPTRFLTWDEIAGVSVLRERWWGWSQLRGDNLAGSPGALARDAFGIDSCLGKRGYFLPDDRRAFAAAIDRFAPPDAAWAHALRAESAGVAVFAHSESKLVSDSGRAIQPPVRPPLVLVFAALDLVAAVLLILVCTAGDHVLVPATESRLWHAWGVSEVVLGLMGAVGLLAASISLFLGKPWARKLMLGVCFFGLAALVIDLPYLAQKAIPTAFEEIRQVEIAKGSNTVDAERVASLGVTIGFGGLFVLGLSSLIGHLVYFTRPRVIAAFDSRRERPGKSIE